MLRLVKEDRKNEDTSAPDLLEIGSCGLHVIHGAFGTGQRSTKWKLGKSLKAFYTFFKMSPARRADYLEINGLADSHAGKKMGHLFPKKYCGHRWLENVSVMSRIIQIFPNLKKFVAEFKSPPETKTFETIKSALCDPMFLPMLEFSRSLAMELEQFLTVFQAEKPLSVFIYEKLKEVLYDLHTRIIKPGVLDENSTVVKLLSLDLSKEENLLSPAPVKIGFGAETTLKKLPTLNQMEVRKFRKAVRNVIIKLMY